MTLVLVICFLFFLGSKEEEDSRSKIPAARAEYKRLKRELMEERTKKTEQEKPSLGMNTSTL